MCIDAADGVQIGHCLGGSVSFSSQAPRRLSDFTMTMTLESRIRTTVPSSQDDPVTTVKIVRSHKAAIPWPASCPVSHDFAVPFRMAVPNEFTPTMRYKKLLSLEHRLTIRVTELLRRDRGMPVSDAVSSPVVLLAAQADASKSSTQVSYYGDVELTAGSAAQSGETFFVQCQLPVGRARPTFGAQISTNVLVGHGDAMFSKRTTRAIEDVKTIVRELSTGHRIAVIELAIPGDVEPSVDISGFVRSHTVTVELTQDGDVFRMPLNVNVLARSSAPAKARSKTVRSPSRALHAQPAGQPVTSDSLALHLRQLSMSSLAEQALCNTVKTVSTTPSATASVIGGSGYASSEVSSKHDTMSSAASSVLSLSPASSISRKTAASTSATPSVSRHSRNASSISLASIAQSIKSRRSSLVGRFAKRLSFDARTLAEEDDLDFSCCGESLPASKTSLPGHAGPGARFTFPAIADAMPTASTSRRSSRMQATKGEHSRSGSTSQLLSSSKSISVQTTRRSHHASASYPARHFIDTVVEDESELACSSLPSLAASIIETASTISSPRTPTDDGLIFWSQLQTASASSLALKLPPPAQVAGVLAFVEEDGRPCTPVDKILLPAPSAADDFDFEYALDTVDRVSTPPSPIAGADDDYANDPFCAWAL